VAEGSKRGAKSKAGARGPSQAEAAAVPSAPVSVRILRAVALAGVYGGLLMPLVVTPSMVVFPFIFSKLLFYQALIGLTFPACLALWLLDPQSRPRRSAVLGALAFYFVAIGISTLRSIDPHRSFWSNQERMTGYFQLLHYFAWFLMASSLLRTWTAWRRLLWWQAGIGFVMASIAVLQRPFPNLLGEPSDVRVSGTLGNAIFSGTWHMIQVFLLAFLWLRTARGSALRILFPAAAAVSLLALWLSGSRGPVLGMIAGFVVCAIVYSLRTRRWAVLGVASGLVAAGVGGYALVAKVLVPLPALAGFWKSQAALLHIFTLDYDPIRQHLWAKAWESFKDRPLTGFGLSTFDIAFDVHHDPWFRCIGLPNTLQDSSHSLLFDHLSTTGVLGTAGFLLLWIAVFAGLVRALRTGSVPQAAAIALLGGPAAYLAQGFFVFDSPGVFVMTYLIFALAGAAAAGELADAPAQTEKPARALTRTWPWAFLALEALGVLLVFQTTVQPTRAAYGTKLAQVAWRDGSCARMVATAREAFALGSPWLDDQLFNVARDLGSLANMGKLVQACPQWRDLVDFARDVTTQILKNHPVHARQRSIFATLLHLVGREAKEPQLIAEAGPLLQTLIAESPYRQQYRYDYANWLVDNGKVQEAREQLEAALNAEETIGDSRWRLGAFLWRNLSQPRQGAELMIRSQAGSCPYQFRNPVELQQLAQAYSVTGDRAGLKTLVGRLEDLGRDDKSIPVYLGIAGYMERLGMIAERDQVLDLVRQRDLTMISKLAPLKDGRAKSLSDLERPAGSPAPGAP
jgi:O-antigen ligase